MRPYFCTVLFAGMLHVSLAQGYDTDLLSKEFHSSRREALRNLLTPNSCAVFFSNEEPWGPVTNRAFSHQDPNMYYFSGLNEGSSMLVIFKESQVIYDSLKTNELIFIQDRDPSREIWNGRLLGKEGVIKTLGFKYAFLNKELPDFNFNFSALDQIYLMDDVNHCPPPSNGKGFENLSSVFYTKTSSYAKEKLNTGKLPEWVASLREIKQPEEMVLLRKAIDISCASHLETMKALQPGMHEYQAQAVIEYMFKKDGSECVGYPSILGGGENSCILHYGSNRKKLEGSNLLVIDAGAEYHGYTADVTRTLPVDGNYSKEEKLIYNIVYEAQEAGIKACRAGNDFRGPHNAAAAVIQDRLFELGVIKKKSDFTTYFFHGTSHYLGLDVHDAGNKGKLAPGNVITVEPGIYIPTGSPCDSKWWNIGVRIEDDVLITSGDPENLSGKLPRKAEEVEAIMKQESLFNKIK
jgi:Xaa-Pro aminopeptidase